MVERLKQFLSENLREKITDQETKLLPSSYQKIGKIIILNLKPELKKCEKEICDLLLENIPNTETVCVRTDTIKDTFRIPSIKIISGKRSTKTTHKENGIIYNIDVKEVMFSKGNIEERKRIISQIKPNEKIIDMFAGIGYFSLGFGKFSEANKIYSIELNPKSFDLLEKNIKQNKISNIVPINGDCVYEITKLEKVDRISMGYLPSAKNYLLDAMKVCKKGTIIHYHTIGTKDEDIFDDVKIAAKISGLKVELLEKTKVKSYKPKTYHYVLDCKIV